MASSHSANLPSRSLPTSISVISKKPNQSEDFIEIKQTSNTMKPKIILDIGDNIKLSISKIKTPIKKHKTTLIVLGLLAMTGTAVYMFIDGSFNHTYSSFKQTSNDSIAGLNQAESNCYNQKIEHLQWLLNKLYGPSLQKLPSILEMIILERIPLLEESILLANLTGEAYQTKIDINNSALESNQLTQDAIRININRLQAKIHDLNMEINNTHLTQLPYKDDMSNEWIEELFRIYTYHLIFGEAAPLVLILVTLLTNLTSKYLFPCKAYQLSDDDHRFVTEVSHQYRIPLNFINSYSSTLKILEQVYDSPKINNLEVKKTLALASKTFIRPIDKRQAKISPLCNLFSQQRNGMGFKRDDIFEMAGLSEPRPVRQLASSSS